MTDLVESDRLREDQPGREQIAKYLQRVTRLLDAAEGEAVGDTAKAAVSVIQNAVRLGMIDEAEEAFSKVDSVVRKALDEGVPVWEIVGAYGFLMGALAEKGEEASGLQNDAADLLEELEEKVIELDSGEILVEYEDGGTLTREDVITQLARNIDFRLRSIVDQ